MKLPTIKHVVLGALLGVAGIMFNTQPTRAASCCLILPPFPSNQITAFVTDYYPTQDSALSLFTMFVTNGGAIQAGTYEGWCIDANTFIDPRQGGSTSGTTYTGSLLSTCDPLELALVPARPGTPPVGPPPIVTLDTWHEVNYILNHKNGAYMWNVQAAINALVGGPVPGPSPPYPPLDTNVVAALLGDAQSNAAAWQSQCGDMVACVFVISNTTPLQLLILEVPCCNLVFTKVPGDTNLGCNPSSIPDCTGTVDTNIINASSCCGAVTITCSKTDSTIDCKNIRIITYTATDTTGNTISTTQTITWTTNSTGPQLAVTATGGNLPCNATPPGDSDIKATVTVTDNCSAVTTNVSHVDSGTSCAMVRTFTITAVDGCGKQAQTQIVYTWTVDTNAPTVSVPTGGDLGCNPKNIPGNSDITVTVTDNCTVAKTNISFVDSGTPCAMKRTFTVTATDGCGNTSAPKTVVYTWKVDTNGPNLQCPPDYFITNGVTMVTCYGQDGWDGKCDNNPCNMLSNCWNKLYTNGYLVCGVYGQYTRYLACSSQQCVKNLLPCSGTPSCLYGSYYNPYSCSGGCFPGHVMCLQLNVDCGDNPNITGFKGCIGNLVLNDPTCALNGKSVRDILNICQQALGGCTLSNGCTISQLCDLCSNLNCSFSNCVPSDWCKGHMGGVVTTNVPPSQSGYATATDSCGGNPTITYSDVITAGDCGGAYTIARTWKATDSCGNSSTCTQNINIGNSKSSVCGYVFRDCNGDGYLTAGIDVGISNIPVTLKNGKGIIVATNITGSDGSYCFYNLTAGTYMVCILAPSNHIQTGGCHTNHWLDNSGSDCWNENDGYQHWKGSDGIDCWYANDGCQHHKNSYGQDCWTDRYGYPHTQNCYYTSCNVPKNNCETFTLAGCESKSSVNFAYQGVVPKCDINIVGPTRGVCGRTYSYTCYVTNSGAACFSSCSVYACGNTYHCPSLKAGESCSFQFNYTYKYSDYGTYNCQATATCNYNGSNYPCTAKDSCNTSVSYY